MGHKLRIAAAVSRSCVLHGMGFSAAARLCNPSRSTLNRRVAVLIDAGIFSLLQEFKFGPGIFAVPVGFLWYYSGEFGSCDTWFP